MNDTKKRKKQHQQQEKKIIVKHGADKLLAILPGQRSETLDDGSSTVQTSLLSPNQ